MTFEPATSTNSLHGPIDYRFMAYRNRFFMKQILSLRQLPTKPEGGYTRSLVFITMGENWCAFKHVIFFLASLWAWFLDLWLHQNHEYTSWNSISTVFLEEQVNVQRSFVPEDTIWLIFQRHSDFSKVKVHDFSYTHKQSTAGVICVVRYEKHAIWRMLHHPSKLPAVYGRLLWSIAN